MRYLTPEEIKKTNREEVHSVLANYTGKSVRESSALRVFLNSYARFYKDKTLPVLDLGAASGGFLKSLAAEGFSNLYGEDIDNYLAEENSKLVKEYKAADLSWDKLPWPDGFFAAASAWCVIPHLENPFHAAREIARVLQRGGLFLLSLPHITSNSSIAYFNKNKDFGSYKASNNHISVLTPGVIAKTMLRDFELLSIEYLIQEKTFQGLKGRLRRWFYNFTSNFQKFRKVLERRWGFKIVYVLRKK